MSDIHPRDKHHRTGLWIAGLGLLTFTGIAGFALWDASDELGKLTLMALEDSYEREPLKTVLGLVVGGLAAWKTAEILNWGLKKFIK